MCVEVAVLYCMWPPRDFSQPGGLKVIRLLRWSLNVPKNAKAEVAGSS